MIGLSRLESLLDGLSDRTIALVGDLFLDRYLEIGPGVQELSLETGQEAFQVSAVRNSPGALGAVISNLAALGVGRLVPVTVIGDDGHGQDLLEQLERLPVDPAHILREGGRLTPTYIKPLRQDASGSWRELNRLDVRTRLPLSTAATNQLCDRVKGAFERCDGLIVIDQIVETDQGVANADVRTRLDDLARQDPEKLILVDSRAHLARFRRGVLKGNRSELLAAAGAPGGDDQDVGQATEKLTRETGRAVFCTLGEKGILVSRPDGRTTISPGVPVDGPIDIVGAGDSATSGIVAALLSGGTETEAAQVGNLVASVTIRQPGTTGRASSEQVLARRRAMGD